ncbi:universal stress protein [Spirochaetota bacterium]
MKKILFVTEFEELWFDALQSIMTLDKAGLNHVVFLHVIQRDKVAMHRGVGYHKSEEIKLKEMANVRFIDWAESLFEQGLEVGAHIVVGDVVPKIISTVKDEGVDLIITRFHKRSKLKDLYSDSEIVDVIRRTSTPILVHKYKLESGKTNDEPFRIPLLAIDWSTEYQKSIDFLLGIKDIVKKVQVVHVLSEKSFGGSTAMEVQKHRKENREKLEEICEIFLKEGVEAEPHLYVGDTVDQIEKAAKERNASLIVVGVTDKGPIKDKLLSSVPSKLYKHSKLSTLFIPLEKGN